MSAVAMFGFANLIQAVFDIAFTGIYHKDAFAVLCIFFINQNNGRRNTRPINKLAGKPMMPLMYPFLMRLVRRSTNT
jgi:hypothetical protein